MTRMPAFVTLLLTPLDGIGAAEHPDGRLAVLLFASTDSDKGERSFNVRTPLRAP